MEKAKEIGATTTINGKSENISQQIKELIIGGVDVFLDAAWVFNPHLMKVLPVKVIIAYRNVFPEVIKLIDLGRMPVEKLVTKRITLDEIVTECFEALVSNPSQVKILIDING